MRIICIKENEKETQLESDMPSVPATKIEAIFKRGSVLKK